MPKERKVAATTVRNRILAGLAPLDRERILPLLRALKFGAGHEVESQEPSDHCLFMETGIVSLRCEPDATGAVEVGLVGADGMIGLPAFLGAPSPHHHAVSLTPCEALAIGVGDLRQLAAHSSRLRTALLHYAAQRLGQAGRRSACHLQHRLEQRLADWLLAATDSLGASKIALTHKQLAAILGATRPGVTLAIQDLEGGLAIRATRNLIGVRSRQALGAFACGCSSGGRYSRTGPRPSAEQGRPAAKPTTAGST